MPSITTLHLAHLPPDLAVHIALYANVRNTPFLHAQLLAGNPDFDYAFINASLILSPPHLLSAIFRACLSAPPSQPSPPAHHQPNPPPVPKSSHSLHSLIVLSLGTTANIASTLHTFGISPSTTDLFVVKVCREHPSNPRPQPPTQQEQITRFLDENVEGQLLDFNQESLNRVMDIDAVRRVYKLASGRGQSGSGKKGGKEAKEAKAERRRRRREGGKGGGDEVDEGRGVEGEGKEEEPRGAGEVEKEVVESGEGGNAVEDGERREMEMVILGMMALRGAG